MASTLTEISERCVRIAELKLSNKRTAVLNLRMNIRTPRLGRFLLRLVVEPNKTLKALNEVD